MTKDMSIFHYTDLSGLKGILDSNSLLATNKRLNLNWPACHVLVITTRHYGRQYAVEQPEGSHAQDRLYVTI